ncbi:hypothetical protein GRF59_02755 [Paenibacillus sp. HJL G12]|uniref:Uncharacterized protein n=1 Tax=Paenibacillus dendrobii TaxID=2691084 RepID=A0A7X3IEP9_9BACL|nr:hypothetical protein [Paenibacillus dendrobii]MWV42539.1 hypothetical protein [Paenibacillus dendrobii]
MKPTLSADLERILNRLEKSDLITLLTERISSSDLNTLLLKVFNEKVRKSSPNDLLKRYTENRFVHPANVEPLQLKQLEMDILKVAVNQGVSPLQLSPVAPLGSTSVVGTVDQNKVISALRGTEVVSDATNLIALHIADLIKYHKSSREDYMRFCTTHRHVRAQYFGDSPGMLAHFHLFCMVTSGVDQGSYDFEKKSLWEHIEIYRTIFKSLFNSKIEVIFSERGGYKDSAGLVSRITDYGESFELNDVVISTGSPQKENQYYKGLQFTIKTVIEDKEYYIGDGGFVDWTQKMLGTKKERLLISAIGLDRLLV